MTSFFVCTARLFVCIIAFLHAQPALSEERLFQIPGGPAAVSLTIFSRQAGLQLIYASRDLTGLKTAPLNGVYDRDTALKKLLENTGLGGEINHESVLIIKRIEPDTPKQSFISPSPPETKEAPEIEEINILGHRYVNRRSIAAKRTRFEIGSSISENDIATFPADTVAELAAILPGLAILPGIALPENFTNELRFGSIRGINPQLNITLLDGVSLAVPNEAGRAQYLDWFPINLSSRIDVSKSFLADMDGGAIGGQINLVSRSGHDYDSPLFNLTAAISHEELNEGDRGNKTPFRLDAIYARQLEHDLGIAASFYYTQRFFYRPQFIPRSLVFFDDQGNFSGHNDFSGNQIAVPFQHRLQIDTNSTRRFGGSVKLDHKPDSDRYSWFTLTYTSINELVLHNKHDVRSSVMVTEQTPTSGLRSGSAEDVFSETGTFSNRSQLYAIITGHRQTLNDHIRWELKGGYSRAEQDQLDNYTLYRLSGGPVSFRYNTEPDLFSITLSEPERILDPGNYFLDKDEVTTVKLAEGIVDIETSLSLFEDNDLFSLKTGARLKSTSRTINQETDVWTPVTPANFTLRDIISKRSTALRPASVSEGHLPLFGSSRLRNRLISAARRNTELFTPNEMAILDMTQDYDAREQIWAAYILARYHGERIATQFGLRYESTRATSKGQRFVVQSNSFTPTRITSHYENFLPSFQVNFDLHDHATLRFAYSRTLARPLFEQFAAVGERLDLDAQVLRRANPDLSPREADNFDISLDSYFNQGRNLVSVALFHKAISNDIFLTSKSEAIDIDGRSEIFTVRCFSNAAASKLTGIEIDLIAEFSSLPAPWNGLGISANATWIDASTEFVYNDTRVQTPLPNQPEQIFNLAFFYSDNRLDATMSLNHTGELLTALDGDNRFSRPGSSFLNEYLAARTVLNAKFRYLLSERLQVFINGANLTSANFSKRFGNDRQFLNAFHDTGYRLEAGITFTF